MVSIKDFLKVCFTLFTYFIANIFGIAPIMLSIGIITFYYYPLYARHLHSVPHRKLSLVVLFFYFSISFCFAVSVEILLESRFALSTEVDLIRPRNALTVLVHAAIFRSVINHSRKIVYRLKNYGRHCKRQAVLTGPKILNILF
ncbi:uncharacterized protein LOC111620200 [Centruroides sculpturatus]|uniref:uncharacterized protein LOC111620200 n=1 Tax=Centruroides sculpturatus TaxID=218467 RepID=UPI000C6CF9B4|nr:uncharacterized protein LOC111620200 [Centruroides sculpturatus]